MMNTITLLVLLHLIAETLVIAFPLNKIEQAKSNIRNYAKYAVKDQRADKFQQESHEEAIDMERTFQQWFEKCQQQVFEVEDMQRVELPSQYQHAKGSIKRSNLDNLQDNSEEQQFNYRCDAFTGKNKIAYFRQVSFHGRGYHILNLLILPNLKHGMDIPVFGADIVSLPGATLANIDFQPLRYDDAYLNQQIYNNSSVKLKKWANVLPSGGALPAKAVQFFSPLCLWTRFPNNRRAACLYLVRQALEQYTDLYCNALSTFEPKDPSTPEVHSSLVGIHKYLQYRIDEDPAKQLLNKVFGQKWTSEVLSDVLFPRNIFPAL